MTHTSPCAPCANGEHADDGTGQNCPCCGVFVPDVITDTGTCRHCGRAIVHSTADGWVDPEATGDDRVWRETCDAHDTFTAEHEPEAS